MRRRITPRCCFILDEFIHGYFNIVYKIDGDNIMLPLPKFKVGWGGGGGGVFAYNCIENVQLYYVC